MGTPIAQHRTMPKTIFTTITPLPAGVSRQTVLDTLHDHLEMIDLNPAHTERHRINPPPEATPEEYHCTWYQITDMISYLPGYKGKVSFKACFHDLASGLYLREDVEMKCNFLMTRFVRKTLKDALATLVARLVVKAQLQEAAEANKRLEWGSPPNSPPLSPPSAGDGKFPRWNRMSTQTAVSEMEGSQKSPGFTRSESGRHPVELRSDTHGPMELP